MALAMQLKDEDGAIVFSMDYDVWAIDAKSVSRTTETRVRKVRGKKQFKTVNVGRDPMKISFTGRLDLTKMKDAGSRYEEIQEELFELEGGTYELDFIAINYGKFILEGLTIDEEGMMEVPNYGACPTTGLFSFEFIEEEAEITVK